MIRRIVLAFRKLLLLFLPAGLRDRCGPAMDEAFEAMLTEAVRRDGLRGALRVAGREAVDLAKASVSTRRHVPRTGGVWMREFVRDLTTAARGLARQPGFALLSVATVAAGLGGTLAMMALVESVLLRPLPYPEPDRVVHVFQTNPELGWDRGPISLPNFDDWRRAETPFLALGAYQLGVRRTLLLDDGPHRVRGARFSGEMFRVLGVPALHGRTLLPTDEGPGVEPVVVLSHSLAGELFGEAATAVGRTVTLDETGYRVVGVMGPDFLPPSSASRFWMPIEFAVDALPRDQSFLTVLGRLGPGVELEEAEATMRTVAGRIAAVHPEGNEGRGLRLERRSEVVTGGVRGQLLLFLGAVGLVLAIACANLAGLTLTRTARRAREVAVRAALGAGRARLAAQIMAESLVIVAVGAGLALPLSSTVLRAVVALGPADLPRVAGAEAGPWTWTAALLLALASSIAIGLVPAWRAARRPPLEALRRDRGHGPSGWGRHLLVVGQVALAVVLLVGGGLLVDSLLRLHAVDTGFRTEGVLTFRLQPPGTAYDSPDELDAFHQDVLAAVERLPGVRSAGATWALPFGENFGSTTYRAEGRPDEDEWLVQIVPVRGEYFRTMGIGLLEGRTFTRADGVEGPPPVVVNRAFAEAVWPGESAVGRSLRRGTGEDAVLLEVIGVVPDLPMQNLAEGPQLLTFWPHRATPWARDLYVAASTDRDDPLSLVPGLRAAVATVDERAAPAEIATMRARLDEQVAGPRFRAALVSTFGMAAALLALLGVYGTSSFTVAGRTREIGVRMALGARRGRVLANTLAGTAAVGLIGVALGLGAAALLSGAVRSLLFRTPTLDPVVYAAVAASTLAAVTAAAWVPARRASGIDPARVLRDE